MNFSDSPHRRAASAASVAAAMPGFADYQIKTARRIPLVALHRKDG